MNRLLEGLFFSVCLLANANIEMPGEEDWGAEFSGIITRASMNLQEAAPKRKHKFKAMNASTSDMAEAALGMASRRPPEEIERLLESSMRHYPDNSFAHLLMAVLKSSQGDPGADAFFESFLLKSTTYSEFEKPFISWDSFHKLRRIVYTLLESRGVSFEGREKDIQVRVPFEALAEYLKNPSREDRIMSRALVSVIIAGILALVACFLLGVDLSYPLARNLLFFYYTVWAAYGLWIFDLAFGLPGGLSRHKAVPVLLGLSALYLVVREAAHFIARSRVQLEEGYERCPYCREVIVKLLVECPKCRRALKR